MNNPEKIKLGGERREITAFFSDVAGFTTISEQLTPDELLALLKRMFGRDDRDYHRRRWYYR